VRRAERAELRRAAALRYRRAMHPVLRRFIVGMLLVCGLAYFALVRDNASEEGLTLWTLDEALAALSGETPAEDGGAASGATNEVPPPPVDDAPRTVRGRVLRFDGVPLAELDVVRRHPYLSATGAASDADGAFALHLDSARGDLDLSDPEWIVLGGRRTIELEAADTLLLVAAPRVSVRGWVRDAAGAPVQDALVRVASPPDLLVPFGLAQPPLEREGWRIWTSSDGSFHVPDAPRVAGLAVEVVAAGFAEARVPVDLSGDEGAVDVRLTRLQ
jgi:hypothetical protein